VASISAASKAVSDRIHQLVGSRVRHRPDQTVALAGLWTVHRQQGQDGRALEPLPRQSRMRLVGAQPGRHAALAIGLARHAHPQAFTRGGVAAFGQHLQCRGHFVRDDLEMRRKTHGSP
jgi:hypothetical protein